MTSPDPRALMFHINTEQASAPIGQDAAERVSQ